MNRDQAKEALAHVLGIHAQNQARLNRIHDYLIPWDTAKATEKLLVRSDHRHTKVHCEIARMSVTPFISLVVDTYSQSLKVDGFYTRDKENGPAWQWWQKNKLAARQTAVHRMALTYGTGYALVLPAPGDAVHVRLASPRRCTAVYADDPIMSPYAGAYDDYPLLALHLHEHHAVIYDEEFLYIFATPYHTSLRGSDKPITWGAGAYEFVERRPHGLGVCPVIRYQDRWAAAGEERHGIVEHLIGLQDRINLTNYEHGVAQHFSAFKQRYVVGWIPNNEGEALKQDASSIQCFENEKVKVGEYNEATLTGYIESRAATIRDFAAIAQVPAYSLGVGGVSNISAEALTAFEVSKEKQASEIQTSLGESHEQLLRLCSHAAGDSRGAEDYESEIKWADTTARSFAQTVDGLGKMAAMLNIPPEMLWEDLPGWTKERVERARAAQSLPARPFISFSDAQGQHTEELF